jgi:hypothetical protein
MQVVFVLAMVDFDKLLRNASKPFIARPRQVSVPRLVSYALFCLEPQLKVTLSHMQACLGSVAVRLCLCAAAV